NLAVRAGEDACEIQLIGVKRIQIKPVVEVEIQHRAIVLAGGDQDGGMTVEGEVVRVCGIEPERLRHGRYAGEKGGQERFHGVTLSPITARHSGRKRPESLLYWGWMVLSFPAFSRRFTPSHCDHPFASVVSAHE